MFLKNSLENKLKKSLAEYHVEKRSESLNKKHTQNFLLFNKNETCNFPMDHKKFNDDDVRAKVKSSKTYVKALIDPDILEIRQKRWNISNLPNQNERAELKKTLFEVSHGLRDYNVTKLKEKIVELGTDSRDACYLGWNCSTYLTNQEKKFGDLTK